MSMSEQERLELRQRLKDDFAFYAPRMLKIRTKSGSVEPLTLNKAQQYIHECIEIQRTKTGRVRAIVLKGRQQGCSTYIEGRYYWRVTHRKGVRAFILTHESEATNNLFDMAARYHENTPEKMRPHTGADSSKELEFDRLDSSYKVGTAGNKAVGRSSTLQYLHGSEVAYWPNAEEHAKGILQAVPDEDDTEIILESTANGMGNYFHEQVKKAMAGESDYIFIFVPWFWQDEYRRAVPAHFALTDEERELMKLYELDAEQIAWRRNKIVELSVSGGDGEMAFKQEYPMSPDEAFQVSGSEKAMIRPETVMRARKCEHVELYGPKIVGVDPARYGKDRTAIIRRRGRRAYFLNYYQHLSTMEIVGKCVQILENEKPDRMFIDVVGLGAGIVDRLHEMGYTETVVAANAGESALDSKRYANRRAEMWAKMHIWLKEQPAKIPDDDLLQADLTGPQHSYNSNSALVLERKEDMEKRGLRSPDGGDALAMTFYEPVKNEAKARMPQPAQKRHY